ncbi:hypothetical protein BSLG_007517 [Batrachochytrium salamandrivorans]|nr:hypothetical protein BASA60_002117 [Batrachochytrium salamandrivorans]KAH9256216.1 hypothetical protein BASA81_005725 [Batrachochytrium salamandrivorans]KAH9268407.1 hypothetical protein BASA83_009406 [Batrachochytrium salamandrivorans]KAJ1334388.1 hypothetical protein BSLG_007543 [Batrachochytrium salamandrivorans]KAJ1336200.1 hypothetical protein BSLG_007517 [Batrachochytrium salamandrivorans]
MFNPTRSLTCRRLFSGSPLRPQTSLAGLTTQKHTSCNDLMLDSVAEANFYSQHRPLSAQLDLPLSFTPPRPRLNTDCSPGSSVDATEDMAHALSVEVAEQPSPVTQPQNIGVRPSVDNTDWYHDEYAKLFNSFAPFVPPSQAGEGTAWHDQNATSNDNSTSKIFSDDKQLLDDFFKSFEYLGVAQRSFALQGRRSSLRRLFRQFAKLSQHSRLSTFAPGVTSESMQLARHINIIKIRRKKMNKHKWKKYRRRVRNSSRYNKEKLRKSGIQRKKQD